MNLNDPVLAGAELAAAVATEDDETIARAAMHHLWPLLTSHTGDFLVAVSRLPGAVLERHPVLQLVHPMTALQARATRPFRPQLYSETARTMSPEEIDFMILAQLISFRASGDIAGSMLYAKRLTDRIDQVRVEARDRLDGPLWFFYHQIASTYLVSGDSAGALVEFATARQLGSLSGHSDAERAALGRIALCHALRGSLGDARRTLAEALARPAATPAHVTSCTATERTTAALIAVDTMSDDLDDALDVLSRYDSTDLTWPFVLLARTRAFLARRQPEEALEAVRLARDSHTVQPGSYAYDIIGSATISSFASMGDIDAAQEAASEYSGAGALTRLAAVRVFLVQHRLTQAERCLRAMTRDGALSPALYAEVVIVSGWAELVGTSDLSRDTALQIHRVVCAPDRRRLIGTLPRQLADMVHARLPADDAAQFAALTAGATRIELHERPALTPGELRVLRALVTHSSAAAIAAEFDVSRNTVKSQLRSLYRKLGCSSREEALRTAVRLYLLSVRAGE